MWINVLLLLQRMEIFHPFVLDSNKKSDEDKCLPGVVLKESRIVIKVHVCTLEKEA